MATIDQYKIQIDVSGQAKVDNLAKSTENATDDLKNLQKQALTSEQALDKFGAGAQRVATITGAAFGLIVGSAIRMADEMVDVGNAFGVSAGFVRALALSLEEAGGKFDSAGKVLLNFYKSLDEVTSLNADTQEAFKQLGITIADLEGKSKLEIFTDILGKLDELGKGVAQTTLGIKIFGKEFANIDPRALKEALASKDYAKLEVEMLKAADAVGAMEYNFRMLQEAALSVLEPLIGEIDNLRLSSEQAKTVVKALGAIFVAAFAASTIANVIKMAGAIKQVAAAAALLAKNPVLRAIALGGLAVGGIAVGKDLMSDDTSAEDEAAKAKEKIAKQRQAEANIAQIIKEEQKSIADQQQRTLDLQNKNAQAAIDYQKAINGTADLSKQEADRARVRYETERQLKIDLNNIDAKITEEQKKKGYVNEALIATYEKQKETITKQAQESEKQKLNALKIAEAERARTVDLQKQLGLMQQQSEKNVANLEAEQMRKLIAGEITEKEMTDALEVAKIKENGALKVLQLEKQIAAEKDEIRRQELQNQLDATKKATDFAISESQRRKQAEIDLQNSSAAGAKKAASESTKAYSKYQVALDSTNTVIKGLENGLEQFAQTGKLNFSDLARSIIADLAKIALKAALNPIFTKVGEGIGGFIGNLFGGFLAEGGPAQAGKPYVVGEKGPELFVPKSAGTVIPNNQLGAGASAMATGKGQVNAPVTNNYITNNISALDAKSVAQLFAENRKTLLGATETARREMAYA